MKKNIVINLIITLIICAMGYIIVTHQSIYNKYAIIGIGISLLLFILGILTNINKISIIGYILAIITTVLIRHETDNLISEELYIFEWIKLIFKNEVVFINVIGNIILYMPLYLLIEVNKYKEIILVLIIIILEILQYILRLGVFDLIDIILNILGIIIVSIICEVLKWMKIKKVI